ncbi:MAG: transcriptional repressor [Clostridia bacterium]|nr:transcriptional repressor [Clostridia bacterium]
MTYRTAQKQTLIAFLRENAETAFTVDALAVALGGENGVGKSTLYRLLPALVQSGEVKRFYKEKSRTAVYQAVGCRHCDEHLHLKCTDCGKLLHLNDDASAAVLRNVLRGSHFAVDEKQTVLFGRCETCRRKDPV